MDKILIVFGTRPELIKLAPIVNEFRKRNQREKLYVINTNQHKDFIQQDIDYFQIDIDHQFNLNRNDDSLSLLNGLLLLEFNELKSKLKNLNITVSAIIAQGDTCTTFSAAQYAFYEKIRFIHIEAGLRTGDFSQPFPEEYFRKIISTIATIHFAPTITAEKNLTSEGISIDTIIVTGNTVIDNLKHFNNIDEFKNVNIASNKLVIITIHRRENIKNKLPLIINRILNYIKCNPDKSFVWINNPGYKIELDMDFELSNLKVIQPVSFFEMIEFYKKAQLIITDSGGIQEEAAYLGIPTLLFRAKTERIEGIDSGISKYFEDSNDDLDSIVKVLSVNKQRFNLIYGDGHASKRIVDFLTEKGY
jgi:UDP-N-acetylglucosamine 2-epimerase (non-hydrolysing)